MKTIKNILTIALFATLTFNVSAKTSSVAKTESNAKANAVIENTLKSTNVTSFFEDELKIENWMVQLKTWKAEKNTFSIEKTETVEKEENIQVEDWMMNVEQFNNENEEELSIESWMFNF